MNRSSWRFGVRKMVERDVKNEFVSRLHEYRNAWHAASFREKSLRGLMWTLLKVNSNAPLVPVFSTIESALRLHSYHEQSPWLLVALQRPL